MSYERLWERLLEFLNNWSTAVEVEPGRIEVTLDNPDGSKRGLEIVMTPAEWDDMVTVAEGDFDSPAQEVRQTLLRLRGHERLLVYDQYPLVPSTTADPPVDPGITRLDELARQHPAGIGRWVVRDRDGNVVDEFDPHRD